MDNKKIEKKAEAVEEIYILEDDPTFKEILANLKEKEIIEYIKKELDKFEEDFKVLCDEFKDRFEKKEWILLSDGLYYIPEITAIIPDFRTQKCYYQEATESFLKSLESMPNFDECFGDFFERFKEPQDKFEYFIVNSNKEINVFFSSKSPNNRNNKIIGFDKKEFDGFTYLNKNEFMYYTLNDSFCSYGDKEKKGRLILTFPIKRLDNNIGICGIIRYWLEHKLRPMSFNSDKTKETYDLLRNLFKKNSPKPDDWFSEPDEYYLSFDRDKKDIIAKWFYEQYNDPQKRQQFYYLPKIKSIYDNDTLIADDEFFEKFKNEILDSDIKRASFDNNDFNSEIVTGLKYGHWDLWDYNELIEKTGKKYIKVSLKDKPCYKRNPYYDFYKTRDNQVAIDFGTKSTVVFYKSDKADVITGKKQIIPIQVSKISDSKLDPYENPSVIEFIDLQSFISDYNAKEGRPKTKWDDLVVSHEAFNDINNEKRFYSIMTELKSWCSKEGGVADKSYTIMDQKNNKQHTFSPYLDIKEGEIDPIELYAYYLGLYINRLSNNKIFSRYKMSFPINFGESVRKKIISSFEKGIIKSLPTSLLNDPKFEPILRRGLVEKSLSEPAAYAITALEKYGFKDKLLEEEENNIHYAVFDFGGGTTDFDFGIYSLNPDENNETYDFILTHFEEQGLPNIGGEKLIKYLAFEFFKSQYSTFKAEGYDIKYTDYDGCPITDKQGFEFYIKPDNMHANINMYRMMKNLRWIFEDPNTTNPNIKEWFFNDKNMTITLLDENNDGKDTSCEFSVDKIEFQKKLSIKLKFAIEEFLKNLKFAFKKEAKESIKNIDKLYIFLAGNSSKSILLNQLLSKYFGNDYQIENSKFYIENFEDDNIFKSEIKKILDDVDDSLVKKVKEELGNPDLEFVIYPPLRTEEAKNIIDAMHSEEKGYNEYNKDDPLEPSGKTGVAYGLLSKDRVLEDYRKNDGEDVSFQFFVGKNVRDKLKPVLSKHAPIGFWSETHVAKIIEDMYEYNLFYTFSPEAEDGKMKIGFANIKKIDLDEEPHDGDLMYIRPVAKNKIEWQVVSNKNDLRTKEDVIEEHCILLD